MRTKVKLFIILTGIFWLTIPKIFAQYTSNDNYTGDWETPTSWTPTWTTPLTTISGDDITIYGYITLNGALSFSGNANSLTINDTLVIKGDLTLSNNSNLIINDDGILIVRGNMIIDNQPVTISNGYLIVTGDLTKNGSLNQGSFTSNDDPVKVFIGGTISPAELTNRSNYPALNCPSPTTTPYPNSTCSYGNMDDLANDPIYPFFLSTCIATPTITANGSTTFCNGESVTLTSSAGSSYLWSNGETTQSINVTATGNYTVQITGTTGCLSAPSIATAVTVNSLPVVDAGTDATIPNGTATTIDATVTGTGPFTFSWSPPALLVDASVEDPTTVNLTSTTVFTLTAASTITSCSNSNTVTITTSGGILGSTPTATPGIVCAGENVQLRAIASGGSGTYTYSWTSNPVGFTSSTADPMVNPVVNTTYYVAVFDGASTVNAQVNVIVNALPVTPTITAGGPTTFCAGGSVILTSSIESSYLWSGGETTQSINVTASGNYSVRVTNTNNCMSAASVPTIVTVNSLPSTPTITASGSTTFCDGESITLTSSAGTNYIWSNAATTQSIDVAGSGNYSVRVINAEGCQSSASAALSTTVNPLPVATAVNNGPVCSGTALYLTGGANGMTIYSWTGSNQFSSLLQNPAISDNAVSSMSGDYMLTVTDANGCQNTATTTVLVNESPLVSITSTADPMCINDSRTLTGNPGGGTFVIVSGMGNISNNTLLATGTGNINLEYSISDICANTATQSIVIDENPIVNAGPDQELEFVFETQMNAELSSSETGEWSLVSGSGLLDDINSPTTLVTQLSIGENIFLWEVQNGNCFASEELRITVTDLFVPSVITPNNDGKNDFFKINFTGRVELIIFNQWGNEEYTNNNYSNDWNGKNNKGTDLPNDTYFYILKFENGSIKKGSVLIKR